MVKILVRSRAELVAPTEPTSGDRPDPGERTAGSQAAWAETNPWVEFCQDRRPTPCARALLRIARAARIRMSPNIESLLLATDTYVYLRPLNTLLGNRPGAIFDSFRRWSEKGEERRSRTGPRTQSRRVRKEAGTVKCARLILDQALEFHIKPEPPERGEKRERQSHLFKGCISGALSTSSAFALESAKDAASGAGVFLP